MTNGECVLNFQIKETPLLHACRRGCVGIIAHLLARGADHSLTNEEGDTCLHIASKFLRVPVVQLLLEFGANPRVRNHVSKVASYASI